MHLGEVAGRVGVGLGRGAFLNCVKEVSSIPIACSFALSLRELILPWVIDLAPAIATANGRSTCKILTDPK